MRQLELARLFLRKAGEDEALLDAIAQLNSVADATFGFHCQQAAEKLLKARLAALGIRFRRTHDLQELMTLLENAGEPLPDSLAGLDELTPFAVDFRYDDSLEDVPFDRAHARRLVRALRAHIEARLGPPG
jgi:HEPN domain-containing protein